MWDRWAAGAGAGAEAEAEAAVRSMQSDAAVVPIVEISVNRRERQLIFNKEGKGLQGGIKRECQKMGV